MTLARHSLIGITLVACAVFVIAGRSAVAQGVVMQRNVSLPMAKAIAEATVAECKSKASTHRPSSSTVPVRCW